MKSLSFTKEELNELESLQISGGTGGIMPLAQTECSNSSAGCGYGTDQTKCSNTVTGCGSRPDPVLLNPFCGNTNTYCLKCQVEQTACIG